MKKRSIRRSGWIWVAVVFAAACGGGGERVASDAQPRDSGMDIDSGAIDAGPDSGSDDSSPCLVGRLTRGSSNTHSCGLDVPSTGGGLPVWTQTHSVAADDETYNGFPFFMPASSISGTGKGELCGGCLEVTSVAGITEVFMVGDVCDVANCGGSQTCDIAQIGIKAADDDVYSSMTSGSGAGNNVMSYRWIPCPLGGADMGLYFTDEGTLGPGYVNLRIYAHVVPIALVELSDDGGPFVPMTRSFTNRWDYVAGDGNPMLSFPINVRITSVFDETVTSAVAFQLGDVQAPLTLHDLGVQFSTPTSSSSDSCAYPGPAQPIYTEGKLQGENQLWFQILDSTSSQPPAFDYDSAPCGPGDQACMAFPAQSAFFPLLVRYLSEFDAAAFYSGIEFECAVTGVTGPHSMTVSYDDLGSVAFDCNGAGSGLSTHSFSFAELGVSAGTLVQDLKIGSGTTGPTGYLIRNLRFTGPQPPGRPVQLPYSYELTDPPTTLDCTPPAP